MRKLMERKPILHTMLWIMVYIVGVNIGDGFEAQTGIPNLVTAAIVLGLSLILIVYLKRNGWMERFGLKRVEGKDLKQALYFAPLLLLVLIQLGKGIDPARSPRAILMVCLLMTGVGFVEELLFRGFLYHAIEAKSGTKRAVLISGVTFGIGHIVNLARGYGYAEQAGQVIVAVAIGITLALVVAITRNIVPGILFHILFNITGSVSPQESGTDMALAAGIIVIALGYGYYLSRHLRKGKEEGGVRPSAS